MAATGDSRKATISDLPPEILSHIFTYLPYNLKVVRLVCSKWNESCNTERVSGNEKIVIYGPNQERVDEFFSGGIFLRNIYYLSLEEVHFETRQISFFEKYAGKLRSLKLIRCAAPKYVPFLQYCKNLRILILDKCPPTVVRQFGCVDGCFVQTNIVSLKIVTRDMWTDETIDDCFRVCPHLRSLSLREPRDIEADVCGVSNISDDGICRALAIRAANIIELNIDGYDTPCLYERIASIPNLKLRKLTIHGLNVTHTSLSNIITLQPDLEEILVYGVSVDLDGSVDWIEGCSKLTHLRIRHSIACNLDGRFLNALTSHLHLRELVLNMQDISIEDVKSEFENSQGTFEHLRTLKLYVPCTMSYDWFLAKVSVNLNQLDLDGEDGISNEMLEFVTIRFTHLETLKFKMYSEDLSEWIDEDRSIERISFGTLGKLKELRIRSRFDDVSCPTKLLVQFKAPNLRYLKLSRFNLIDATSLVHVAENYPSLERYKQTWIDEYDLKKFQGNPSYTRIIGSLMSHCKRLSSFNVNGCEALQILRR